MYNKVTSINRLLFSFLIESYKKNKVIIYKCKLEKTMFYMCTQYLYLYIIHYLFVPVNIYVFDSSPFVLSSNNFYSFICHWYSRDRHRQCQSNGSEGNGADTTKE